MNKIFIIIFLTVLLFSAASENLRADSYRDETTTAYFDRRSDNLKFWLFQIGNRFYFSEVDLENCPYSEAAFYQQTGYIGLNAMAGKAKVGNGKENIKAINPEIKLVMPVIPIFVIFSYQRMDWDGTVDLNYLLDQKKTSDDFKGDLGYYITDGFTLDFTCERENVKENDKYEPLSYDFTQKTKINTLGGYFKYVVLLNEDMAFTIKGIYTNENSSSDKRDKYINNSYAINAEYYFTNGFGIGGSFEYNKGDDDRLAGKTFGINTVLFFGPSFGIYAEFNIFKPHIKIDNPHNDYKSFAFLASLRI